MAKKAKKKMTAAHRKALVAGQKRRREREQAEAAQKKGPAISRKDRAAQKVGWGKSDMPNLRLSQIEKGIKDAQAKIKKLRAHRTARLKLLRKLQAELMEL